MKNPIKFILSLAVAGLLLSACGGGSSSSSGGVSPQSVTNKAATAKQKFGSVAQSSNVDGGGTTLDSVVFDPDGPNGGTITKTGGVPWTVSVSDALSPDEAGNLPFFSRLEDGRGLAVLLHLDNPDGANYLSYGLWLVGNFGEPGGVTVTEPTIDEVGLFVDGDEIAANDLPATGGATYTGPGFGLYYAESADNPLVNRNGQFNGDVEFTAAFNQESTTVNGKMNNFEFDDESVANFEILFESANFANGGFVGEVSCGSGGICQGNPGGSWGAQFFGTPDTSDGNKPPLFGGTFGLDNVQLQTTEGGGTQEATLDAIGIFSATKQ